VLKNDAEAYAMFKVVQADCSVTALLHVAKGRGKLKSYPPGMYNLVEFCNLLPLVCMLAFL
jgi:hypothetical protein